MSAMRKIKEAFIIVFEKRFYVALAVFSSLLIGLLYLISSQIIAFFPDGIFFEFNLIKLTLLTGISALFGIVFSMQVFFLRLSKIRAKETGTAVGGVMTGFFTMSCCTPILPSLLAFFGVSGSFLISTTAFFGKYLYYFSALSFGLLLLSIFILSRSLTIVCKFR